MGKLFPLYIGTMAMIIAVALTLQGQDLMATDAYRRTFEEVLQNLPVLLDDLERGLTEFQ